jgi:hypothetical protein
MEFFVARAYCDKSQNLIILFVAISLGRGGQHSLNGTPHSLRAFKASAPERKTHPAETRVIYWSPLPFLLALRTSPAFAYKAELYKNTINF